MLGLLFLYFIGKYFYELAQSHKKSAWGYAILGVITHYAGAFTFGLILGLFDELFSWNFLDDTSEMVIGFIALPFGLMSCWGLYTYLNKKWSKEDNNIENQIQDFGVTEQPNNLESDTLKS